MGARDQANLTDDDSRLEKVSTEWKLVTLEYTVKRLCMRFALPQ